MKNLLFVAVALSVFTVTSLTAKAQPKLKFIAGTTLLPEDATDYSTTYLAPAKTKKVTKVNFDNFVATELCNSIQFKYAQLLNADVETITNIALFASIEEWWGTRYRYGGTTHRGIDCSSYTGHVIEAAYGITLPRTARTQYGATTRVNRMDLEEGDLVFFNTRGGVSHVGIYLRDGYFTHSSSSHGVTISNLDEAYYSRKYIGGGRVVKPTEELEQEETIAPISE
jgi:murein DD-endopeptidase / murein LD-carboxypeptidase